MASSPDHPPPFQTSATDCPQCGDLCLGAITLPCGHLSCRRCCHQLFHHRSGSPLTCHSCGQHVSCPNGCSNISQVIQQFGTDPVLDHLVRQRLQSEGPKHCLAHENSDATMVCEDCHDYFCDTCSRVHSRQRVTIDHVLRLLPNALHNSSPESCVPTRPKTSNSSSKSAMIIRNSPRVTTKPKAFSNSSTDSAATILNSHDPLPRGQSAGDKEGKQWIEKEVKLMQQSTSEWHTLQSTVKEIVPLGKQLLSMVEAQEQVLLTCADFLSSLDVTKQMDSQTYVVRRSTDDVETTVNTETLELRLHGVRNNSSQPLSLLAAETTRAQLAELLHSQGE